MHLVWAPLGPAPVERFAASYRRLPAGLDHRLVVLLNGFEARAAAAEHLEPLAGIDHDVLVLDRPVLDLTAYAWGLERVDGERVCLLNSHSVLLAPGWLAALDTQLSRPGIGMVGATGSYERPHSALPWRRRRWPAFPNPHLRSNALLAPRDLLRSLDWRPVTVKRQAWELESGRRGLSRQVLDQGLDLLVVGRDGAGYEPDRWPESATFRSGEQANLLVEDNRTRQWVEAPPAEREALARRAWGKDPVAATAAVRARRAAGGALARPRTATR